MFATIFGGCVRFGVDQSVEERSANLIRISCQQHNLTGLMLYKEGNFLILFEGEKEPSEHMFKLFAKRPEFTSVMKFSSEKISQRSFDDFYMGFPDYNTSNPITQAFRLTEDTLKHYLPNFTTKNFECFVQSFAKVNQVA